MASSTSINRVSTPTSGNKSTSQPVAEVVTLSDLTQQILANAEILFPREEHLRVVTAQTPSGLLYHSLLVADKPQPKEAQYRINDTKIVVKSQGTQERRGALMDLLQETERRVGKELLKYYSPTKGGIEPEDGDFESHSSAQCFTAAKERTGYMMRLLILS
ncbi:MAG: hypothetical protein Q9157_001523 [Trypethelium eluteriae]